VPLSTQVNEMCSDELNVKWEREGTVFAYFSQNVQKQRGCVSLRKSRIGFFKSEKKPKIDFAFLY